MSANQDMFDDPFQQELFLALWHDTDLFMDEAAALVANWAERDWWTK